MRPLLWEAVAVDPSSPFFRERDIRDRVAGAKVPVLYTHGFLDYRVKPDMFLEWVPRLGRPARLWLGQWGHGSPYPAWSGRDGWLDAMLTLFDRELAGRDVKFADPRVVVQEGPSGRYRGERRWPPGDVEMTALAVAPGSYLDAPGNSGEKLPLVESPSSVAGITGLGAWTRSGALAAEAHLAGVPRLAVEANSSKNAVIVALLYDIAPDGSALLVTRGAARVANGRAEFGLQPQDWRFAQGHRIGLLLTGADGEYWLPLKRTLLPVHVRGGSLSLPILRNARTQFLDGRAGPALLAKKPIRGAG